MTRVVRLLTLAELDEGGTGDLSVSAQLDAVLDDRRRIVLWPTAVGRRRR